MFQYLQFKNLFYPFTFFFPSLLGFVFVFVCVCVGGGGGGDGGGGGTERPQGCL